MFRILAFILIISAFSLICDRSAYDWREINETEMRFWYNDVDRCILKQKLHSQSDLKLIKSITCNATSNLLLESGGSITTGYALNEKQCTSPLSDRPFLKMAMKGFSDPNKTTLLHAVYKMISMNMTLVFLGDSVIGQVYEASFAEIIRQSLIKSPSQSPRKLDKAEYLVYEGFYEEIIKNGGNFDRLMVGDKTLTVIWIRCVYVYGGGNTHPSSAGHWRNATPVIEKLVSHFDGMLLLSNIGLWYNDRTVFNKEILEPLLWLDAKAESMKLSPKRVIFAWQETTAQHFDLTINGYFRTGPMYKNHRNCIPQGSSRIGQRDGPDGRTDWRNDDVKKIISTNNITNLHLIRVALATRPLYSLHVTRPRTQAVPWEGGQADCTHFCWTPVLWQPTWNGIAEALCKSAKIFGQKNDISWCENVLDCSAI